MNLSNLSNEVIQHVNEHFTTLREVLVLKHISRRWFYYDYITKMSAQEYTHFPRFKPILNITDNLSAYNPMIYGLEYYNKTARELLTSDYIRLFTQLKYLKCHEALINDEDLSYLQKLTYLECKLCDKLTPVGFSHLSKLEVLKIEFQFYSKTDVIGLLPNLKELELFNTNIGDNWFKSFPKLQSLKLRLCYNITDKGLSYLTQLTKLSLIKCPNITDNGLSQLVNLMDLYLDSSVITDEGIKYLTKLTHLDISECKNNITNEGIENLIQLKYLRLSPYILDGALKNLIHLTYLFVPPKIKRDRYDYNFYPCMTNEGIKHLTKLRTLKCIQSGIVINDDLNQLTELNYIMTSSFEYNGSGHFNNITKLKCYNPPSADGIKYLSKLKHLECKSCDSFTDDIIKGLKSLTYLDCTYSFKITDEGIKELTELTHLSCPKSTISDRGIMYLTKLTYLDCTKCDNVTDASITLLTNLTHLICTYCFSIRFDSIRTLSNLRFLVCDLFRISRNDLRQLPSLKKVYDLHSIN